MSETFKFVGILKENNDRVHHGSLTQAGSGAVVTDVSESGGVLTITKDASVTAGIVRSTTTPSNPCLWVEPLSTSSNIGYGTIT